MFLHNNDPGKSGGAIALPALLCVPAMHIARGLLDLTEIDKKQRELSNSDRPLVLTRVHSQNTYNA